MSELSPWGMVSPYPNEHLIDLLHPGEQFGTRIATLVTVKSRTPPGDGDPFPRDRQP